MEFFYLVISIFLIFLSTKYTYINNQLRQLKGHSIYHTVFYLCATILLGAIVLLIWSSYKLFYFLDDVYINIIILIILMFCYLAGINYMKFNKKKFKHDLEMGFYD